MDFIAHFFWNHLPYVESENRIINGKEEVCLIIPTKTNQLKKGKRGNWVSTFRMVAVPPNEEMTTHEIQLGYLNYDEVDKAKKLGVYSGTQHIGRVREHDRTPSKKVNRDNSKSIDLISDGAICLDNIQDDLLVRNPQNKKYYLKCTFRRKGNDGTAIFSTGAICIDDIPQECIITNPRTGKRNVRCRFKRSEFMDTYYNTHELVCVMPDGSEIEIGRFREWTKATNTQKRVAQFQSKENPQQQKANAPTIETVKRNDNIIIDGLNL